MLSQTAGSNNDNSRVTFCGCPKFGCREPLGVSTAQSVSFDRMFFFAVILPVVAITVIPLLGTRYGYALLYVGILFRILYEYYVIVRSTLLFQIYHRNTRYRVVCRRERNGKCFVNSHLRFPAKSTYVLSFTIWKIWDDILLVQWKWWHVIIRVVC